MDVHFYHIYCDEWFHIPVDIYLLKVNNRNSRTRHENFEHVNPEWVLLLCDTKLKQSYQIK